MPTFCFKKILSAEKKDLESLCSFRFNKLQPVPGEFFCDEVNKLFKQIILVIEGMHLYVDVNRRLAITASAEFLFESKLVF